MMKCSQCTHCQREEAARKREEQQRMVRNAKEPSKAWRRFEYSDGWDSNKFWQIRMDDYDPTVVWIRYGKMGTQGTTIKKDFTWSYEARAFYTEKVTEKLGKDYNYVGVR